MSDSYSLRKNYQIENKAQNMSDFSNFFSPIHNTHITQLPPGGLPKNIPPGIILQNNIKYPIKKKTLILDLDETLVHSSMRPFQRCADITLPINYNGKNIFIYVLRRPFLDKFLEEMSLLYEIIIFTASLADYSEPLLDIIDKKKVIKLRLNRSHCRHYQNIYIKDLKVINRNLKDMIIVDNNPESYLMNKENAIPILTWEDDPNDKELLKLIPVLKYLANVDDVRIDINKIVDRNVEEVDFDAFNRLSQAKNKLNDNSNNIFSNKKVNNISNKNNINYNQNINNNIDNNIILNNNINNKENNNINYNFNKKIYIKKEILNNGKLNKRISFPNNTTNKFILNNSNQKLFLNTNQNNSHHNLYPQDSKRKIGAKTLKLNIDNNQLQRQYASNLNLSNFNKVPQDSIMKARMNTSPLNQINVSNSTINIYNNKPEIKILFNGPNRNPDMRKITKIKEEALTPIRTAKNRKIIFYPKDNPKNLITPVKEDYHNSILTNKNIEKTYDSKITKTVSVRKLFGLPNHSLDNIISNENNLRKLQKIKTEKLNSNNNYKNNGFEYNQNMMKFMKINNVKNTNDNSLNNTNKIIKINNPGNPNFKNLFLRNDKNFNNSNSTTKIKNIEVIHSQKNIKSPNKNVKVKRNVKEKPIKTNKDSNNSKIQQTKKIIIERDSFSREKFLKDNFGIVV